MSNHTPGPWAVGQYTPTPFFISIKNHACVCDPRSLALIATCGRANDRQSQIDADLIAAAPDLLAACECALSVMTGSEYGGAPGTTLALATLRAAIAKAKGGAA